jgi:hypothetical protein
MKVDEGIICSKLDERRSVVSNYYCLCGFFSCCSIAAGSFNLWIPSFKFIELDTEVDSERDGVIICEISSNAREHDTVMFLGMVDEIVCRTDHQRFHSMFYLLDNGAGLCLDCSDYQ